MSNTLDDMLDDAKILADYGWRSGQLKNARLFEAIAAFENLGTRSWKAPETVNLQDSLNEAIVAMAPITLSDIKLRNPFAEATRPDTVKRIALIAFSIVLMVLTARFTILYNEGNELSGLFHRISEERPAEKMAAVARQWRASVKTDEDSNNETYFRMLDEVRDLDRQVREYNTGYPAYRERVNWPWNDLWRYFFAPPVDPRDNLPQVSCAMMPNLPPASPPPAAAPPAAGEQPAAQSALPTAEQPAQQAGSAQQQVAPASPPLPPDFGSVAPGLYLKQNKELIASFACMESLEITPYSMHAMVEGYAEIQSIIKLLGLWLLPGFYGALGATISYMRAILNPVLPDPPMERIVHRIALGGFAGIIFAWFWAPSTDATQQFVGLTINSFAVAFIIGFSIDVLFALLDTVVRFLQGIVNQIGQASAGPAPAAAGGAPRPMPEPAQPEPPRPPPAVIQSMAPSAITRGATPAVLKLSGRGLADMRAVTMKNGAVSVAATDVKALATSVTFSVVLDDTQPAGNWTVEASDASGATIVAPQPLSVA